VDVHILMMRGVNIMTILSNRKEIFVIFLFLFVFVNYYSYPDMIGDDINATMYVDESVCDSAIGYETHYELCDRLYDELEEEGINK
jgi:hypothetical protein